MLLAALSLTLLANQPTPPVTITPRAERIARVSVQILAAEEIGFGGNNAKDRSSTKLHRQHRTRNGMPMVEFY